MPAVSSPLLRQRRSERTNLKVAIITNKVAESNSTTLTVNPFFGKDTTTLKFGQSFLLLIGMASEIVPKLAKRCMNENSEAVAVKGIHPAVFFPMNKSYARRLNRLVWEAIEIQYHLACLSTLGGAYHLCNHPETALIIAIRQEMIAKKLGSTSVMLRSKVFQAVNLGLLGKRKESSAMFRYCISEAMKEGWTEMSGFVEASRKWLEVELGQQKLRKIRNGSEHGSISGVRETFPISSSVQELK